MAIKCKPYSEITVESGTQLKIVHICSVMPTENPIQMAFDQKSTRSDICPLPLFPYDPYKVDYKVQLIS